MPHSRLFPVLCRGLLLGGLWAVLTGLQPKGLVVGAMVVPAAVWISLRLLPAGQPRDLARFPRHGARFIAGSLSGGIDVARRALSPAMRLKPGWIEVPLPQGSGAGPAIGGELSLMPGTLAAGRVGDRLLVHLIDTESGFERAIPGIADELRCIIEPEQPRHAGRR